MTEIEKNKLAKKVREAILSHEAFNQNWRLELLEEGKVIKLIGTVPTKEDVEIAEKIAKQQEGVLSVVNELNVDTSPDDDFKGMITILPAGQF